MNKILGIGMILYSAGCYGYWYFTPTFEATNKFWIQIAIAGIGGVFVLGKEVLPALGGLIPKKSSLKNYDVKSVESIDYECLVHLRNRVTEANSKEGIEAVNKLNTVMFALRDQK